MTDTFVVPARMQQNFENRVRCRHITAVLGPGQRRQHRVPDRVQPPAGDETKFPKSTFCASPDPNRVVLRPQVFQDDRTDFFEFALPAGQWWAEKWTI